MWEFLSVTPSLLCLGSSDWGFAMEMFCCRRALGSLPGILSQPMPMEQDRGAEEEDAPAPYMPIVPQGMSTSAPAPQVATLLQLDNIDWPGILAHAYTAHDMCHAFHFVILSYQISRWPSSGIHLMRLAAWVCANLVLTN